MKITKDMTIGEVIKLSPYIPEVLSSFHIGGCGKCSVSDTHRIEDVCKDYGINEDQLLFSLNNIVDSGDIE